MMSMDRVISWVVGKEFLLWPACFLNKILLAFALLHFVIQGQTCLLFWISLDFPLLQSLMMKRTSLLVLVLEGLVGLRRTVQLQLLKHSWSGHRLGLPRYWMVCLGNEPRSFCHFWDCTKYWTKYCTKTFVDYEGFSISSRGFLSTVVEIMIIWFKFK